MALPAVDALALCPAAWGLRSFPRLDPETSDDFIHPRHLGLLPRQRRLPAARRRDRRRRARRSASPGRRATPRFPHQRRRRTACEQAGISVERPRRTSASTTSRCSSSSGSSRPTSASRRAGFRSFLHGRARCGSRTSSTSTGSSATSSATTGDDPLRRAPRVARGERVLPVAVRGGGDPDDGRRRRVGDRVDRRRPRATTSRSCEELHWPDSLGLLYSAFTYYTGFKVNSGEYKVMGLAPYGEPKYVDLIYDELIDLREDGSFTLNQKYFNYLAGLTMTNGAFDELFGGPPREPETKLTQREMDLARSVQEVCEEIMLRMARTAHRETGLDEPLPGRRRRAQLRRQRPAAARGAVQAALDPAGRRRRGRRARRRAADLAPAPASSRARVDAGPRRDEGRLPRARSSRPTRSRRSSTSVGRGVPAARARRAARARAADCWPTRRSSAGSTAGWSSARARSAPAASSATRAVRAMQAKMNLKIKFREGFRPFAPSVLRERVARLLRAGLRLAVHAARRAGAEGPPDPDDRRSSRSCWGIEKLNVPRSDIPAVTHIDYSARVQTVTRETQPGLLRADHGVRAATGCPVLVNTSFNVRGEPIVCTPEDAYRCFMRTDIDYLVLGPFLLDKTDAAGVEGDRELAAGVPARLTPAEGRQFGAHRRRRVLRARRRRLVARTPDGRARCSARSAALLVARRAADPRPARAGVARRGWGWRTRISKVTTPIFMGVMYFLVLTPIGLLAPALGGNPLAARTAERQLLGRPRREARARRPAPAVLAEEDDGRADLLSELWAFMRERKKWWLLPIIVVHAAGRRAARLRAGLGAGAVHLHDLLESRGRHPERSEGSARACE